MRLVALHTVAWLCASANLANKDTPVLTDSFSRGYDPYTHACRARPLSTDGWTSLRVTVIVIAYVVAESVTRGAAQHVADNIGQSLPGFHACHLGFSPAGQRRDTKTDTFMLY